MECRWIFVIGVIVLNIYKVNSDMIEPVVEEENKLVIENTETKDRHDTSLFPKMIKKFVVALDSPRSSPVVRVASKRRLLPQFMLKQRVNDPPVGNKSILARQPLMKRRKFTVKPRNLNLSVNINNMNRKNPIFFNNQHKLKLKNNINDIPLTKNKNSSEEHIEKNKNSQKDTSNESNEMFQTDTFGVFGKEKHRLSNNLKKESVPSLSDNEFDVSQEVNTLSSIISEENNSNETIQKTNTVKNDKEKSQIETSKVGKLSINKKEYTDEENADQNEFLFTGSHIKTMKTSATKKVDASTTERTRNMLSSRRLERSVNIIEEEHLATASSSFHSTGRDSLFDLDYAYKNIHT